MGSKVPVPSSERSDQRDDGTGHSRYQRMVGMRGDGVECAGGSRARRGVDSAEGLGVGLHGNDQREDSDKAVQKLPWDAEEAVLGESLLGAGIFHQYHRR